MALKRCPLNLTFHQTVAKLIEIYLSFWKRRKRR